jgi:hypothetical protein
MMVTYTNNPNPKNSAEPHGNGCGADEFGQTLLFIQPAPPNQSLKPEATNFLPITKMTGPVTIGGKVFCKTLEGATTWQFKLRNRHKMMPRRHHTHQNRAIGGHWYQQDSFQSYTPLETHFE